MGVKGKLGGSCPLGNRGRRPGNGHQSGYQAGADDLGYPATRQKSRALRGAGGFQSTGQAGASISLPSAYPVSARAALLAGKAQETAGPRHRYGDIFCLSLFGHVLRLVV